MSATKTTRKWAATASLGELTQERESLARCRDEQKNPMVRASFSQRVEIIDAEIKRRGVSYPACDGEGS
jgi:hypothetical protein